MKGIYLYEGREARPANAKGLISKIVKKVKGYFEIRGENRVNSRLWLVFCAVK